MPKFKEGQVVIYVNGDKYELGIIKTVIPVKKRYAQKQDGMHGEPTGEFYTGYDYFVNYHTGDTAARTDERLLHPIINDYAFKIKRLLVSEEK